jgi:hypothetical protein
MGVMRRSDWQQSRRSSLATRWHSRPRFLRRSSRTRATTLAAAAARSRTVSRSTASATRQQSSVATSASVRNATIARMDPIRRASRRGSERSLLLCARNPRPASHLQAPPPCASVRATRFFRLRATRSPVFSTSMYFLLLQVPPWALVREHLPSGLHAALMRTRLPLHRRAIWRTSCSLRPGRCSIRRAAHSLPCREWWIMRKKIEQQSAGRDQLH